MTMKIVTSAPTVRPIETLGLARGTAIVVSAALGLFLIWGVGFAAPQSIHEAAHDTRHSISFPCH
jgi:cobalt transporter subunit CbtB